MRSTLLALPILAIQTLAAVAPSSNQLASTLSTNGLTTTYNFTFPSATLNSDDASRFVLKNWDLNGRISFGNSNVVFSPDPSTSTSTLVRRASKTTSSSSTPSPSSGPTSFPNSTDLDGSPPALRIEYPQGSYSKATGGTQFYASPWNRTGGDVEVHERMMLSYDVWFPSGFAWNMGGKLPGLRGGPDRLGCSGGNETDGKGCFSTRIMWRSNGAAEVYAYIPKPSKSFCSQTSNICNSDFGTSLARGSFSLVTGQWQTIWLMVVLNQVGTANGIVELWYNGVQAMSFTNLELRASASLSSVGGLFFSTFFGGDNADWATPTTQYAYFRNMQLFAGSGAATGPEEKVSAASASLRFSTVLVGLGGVIMLGLLSLSAVG